MSPRTGLALAALALLSAVLSAQSACHPGRKEGQSCKLSAVSQCDTCSGLKCRCEAPGACTCRLPPSSPAPGEQPSSASCSLPVSGAVCCQKDGTGRVRGDPVEHTQRHEGRPLTWTSNNAVDLKAQAGSQVVAAEAGTICPRSSYCCVRKDVDSDVYGVQLKLVTDSGKTLFYTHLDGNSFDARVCGTHVQAGVVLGAVAKGGNGMLASGGRSVPAHVHVALDPASVGGGGLCSYLRGCSSSASPDLAGCRDV